MEYYVKGDGNNLNDGMSLSTAFQTITKGVQTIQSGDTLFIMPGLYSELVSLVTSGTELNRIKIVCCNNGIDLSTGNVIDNSYKGEVILSYCDNLGNTILNTTKFDFNSKSYIDLYGLKCISIDDCILITGTNNNIWYSHVSSLGVSGSGGISGGASYKTDNNSIYWCTSRGAYRGIENIKNVWHSISNNTIGFLAIENLYFCKSFSTTGFQNFTNAVNCEGYNCNITFNNVVGNNCTLYNCLSANGGNSFVNNVATPASMNVINGYSINCQGVAINSAGSASVMNLSSIYASGYIIFPTGPLYSGNVNILTYLFSNNNFNSSDIEALFPRNLTQDISQLDYNIYRDLLNQPLKLTDGIVKVGATQRSVKEYVSKDELKILRRGIHSVKPRLEVGNYTVSCLMKYDLGGGTLRPQILIRDYQNNKLVNESEVTADSSTDYIEVTANFDMKNNGIIDIQFFNQETNVNAFCLLKNIKLQKN